MNSSHVLGYMPCAALQMELRQLMTNAWIICHFTSMANTAKIKRNLQIAWKLMVFFASHVFNVLNVQSCVYLIDNNTTRVSCKRQRRGQPFLVMLLLLLLLLASLTWKLYALGWLLSKLTKQEGAGRCWVGTICTARTFVLFCFFLCLLSPPFPINWVVLSTEPQIDYLIWFWKFWSTRAWGLPGADDDVIIFPILIVDECKVRLVFRIYLEEMSMSFIFLSTIRIHHGKLYILFFTFMRRFFIIKQTPWNMDNVPFGTMYNTIQLYQGSFSSIYVFNTN
jgi:hypothetical protein